MMNEHHPLSNPPIELRKNASDGLGGASGSRNDVAHGRSATSPLQPVVSMTCNNETQNTFLSGPSTVFCVAVVA